MCWSSIAFTKAVCVVNGRHPYVGNGEVQVLATGVVLVEVDVLDVVVVVVEVDVLEVVLVEDDLVEVVVDVVDFDEVEVFSVVGVGVAMLPAGFEELVTTGVAKSGLPRAVVVLEDVVVLDGATGGAAITGRPASVPETPRVNSNAEICMLVLM